MNLDLFNSLKARTKVDSRSGCWVWQGYKSKGGYGSVCRRVPGYGKEPVVIGAHRAMYAAAGGRIRKGHPHLDHRCDNPSCINPDHLEPVTHKENHRRRKWSRTHCVKGHSLTPDNVVMRGESVRCIKCERAYLNKHSAKKALLKREKDIEEFVQRFADRVPKEELLRIYDFLKPIGKLKGLPEARKALYGPERV